MKFVNAFLLGFALVCSLTGIRTDVETNNVGQSLTDLIKDCMEKGSESFGSIANDGLQKTKGAIDTGVKSVSNLFFDGENSQIADIGGIASSGLEKGKDGFNAGVGRVKELFFNDQESQLADLNKIAADTVEAINENVPEVKEKSVGFGKKVVNWFKNLFD